MYSVDLFTSSSLKCKHNRPLNDTSVFDAGITKMLFHLSYIVTLTGSMVQNE